MTTETTIAVIEDIYPLTDSIMALTLAPEKFIDYLAGQYLQIQSGEQFLSYSIANAALGSRKYELHIRQDYKNKTNQTLFADIKKTGSVQIRLPLGSCHIQALEPNIPIVFIAGGTGFAPIKAMVEQLLANSDPRPFELYWSARSESDLYMDDKVRQWALHVKHFSYFSLLPCAEKRELVVSKLKEQHPGPLKEYQLVIAGPFDMANAVKEDLLALGALPGRLYSDAFSI